jgi:hypothetical protein
VQFFARGGSRRRGKRRAASIRWPLRSLRCDDSAARRSAKARSWTFWTSPANDAPGLARARRSQLFILESRTMACIQRCTCLLLVAILASAAGCSSDASNPSPAATSKADSPAAAPAPLLKPDVPQTPEAAVEAVFDGLKSSKPIVVWNVLPDAAQTSLNSLVSRLARGVDAEVWNHTEIGRAHV